MGGDYVASSGRMFRLVTYLEINPRSLLCLAFKPVYDPHEVYRALDTLLLIYAKE